MKDEITIFREAVGSSLMAVAEVVRWSTEWKQGTEGSSEVAEVRLGRSFDRNASAVERGEQELTAICERVHGRVALTAQGTGTQRTQVENSAGATSAAGYCSTTSAETAQGAQHWTWIRRTSCLGRWMTWLEVDCRLV